MDEIERGSGQSQRDRSGNFRAGRILLAYCMGALTIGVLLLVQIHLIAGLYDASHPITMQGLIGAVQGGLVVAPLLAIAGVPPAVLGISLAEWYDRRSPLAHCLGGVVVALFCLYALGFGSMAINDESGLMPEFSTMDLMRASPLYIVPGLVAGLVYWRVRGALASGRPTGKVA